METKTEDETEQQGFGGRPGFWGNTHGQWGHNEAFGRAHFGQRGWLRPAILKLLDKKPMNGMEIINEFAEASHGWWKPSPGSVYPLLETLETEELIKKKNDGRYEVTTKFKNWSKPTDQMEEIMTNMESSVSYLEEAAASNKTKLSTYKKRIEKINERLSKLK